MKTQSIFNKLLLWGQKKVTLASPSIVYQILRIRNQAFQQSRQSAPHVIVLRGNAAAAFLQWEKEEQELWLKARSPLQKLFGITERLEFRHLHRVATVQSPCFGDGVAEIEAIVFGNNLQFVTTPPKGAEMAKVEVKLLSSPNPNIVIKENYIGSSDGISTSVNYSDFVAKSCRDDKIYFNQLIKPRT